jgi:hypothetical protein
MAYPVRGLAEGSVIVERRGEIAFEDVVYTLTLGRRRYARKRYKVVWDTLQTTRFWMYGYTILTLVVYKRAYAR